MIVTKLPFQRSLEATILLYLTFRSQRKIMQLHLLTQPVIKYKLLLVTKLDLRIVAKQTLSSCKNKLYLASRAKSQEQALYLVKVSFFNTCGDVSSAPVVIQGFILSPYKLLLQKTICNCSDCKVCCLALLCLLHNNTCRVVPANVSKRECCVQKWKWP